MFWNVWSTLAVLEIFLVFLFPGAFSSYCGKLRFCEKQLFAKTSNYSYFPSFSNSLRKKNTNPCKLNTKTNIWESYKNWIWEGPGLHLGRVWEILSSFWNLLGASWKISVHIFLVCWHILNHLSFFKKKTFCPKMAPRLDFRRVWGKIGGESG